MFFPRGDDLDMPLASRMRVDLDTPRPRKSMLEKMTLFPGIDLDTPLASRTRVDLGCIQPLEKRLVRVQALELPVDLGALGLGAVCEPPMICEGRY